MRSLWQCLHRCGLLAGLLGMMSGCDGCFDGIVKDEFSVGRRCSQSGACPPGQRCSSDGQCLKPCPTPDCEGDACGCVGEGREGENGPFAATCLADGLCHMTCAPPHDCPQSMECAGGQCYAQCPEGYCPKGRECVSSDFPSRAHCVSSGGSDLDGGVGDGGATDGGPCTTCGESCVDLETDPQNCGACDHSCSGAACEAGICRALAISGAVFSNGPVLGQDPSNLYIASPGEGRIYRCPKVGCAVPPDLVVEGPEVLHTDWLGAEGADLYWFTITEGKLWRCQSDPCDTPNLVWEFGSNVVQDIAMDSSGIYLATHSGILRCELGSCEGGPVSIYSDTDTVHHLALRGGTLAFNALSGGMWPLLTCETPDCAGQELVGQPINAYFGLALSDAQIYWWAESSGAPGKYAVYTCPLSGCGPGPTPVSVLNDLLGGLTASGLGAFYTVGEMRLRGFSETLQNNRAFEPSLYVNFHLLADDQFLFFTDELGYLYRLAPW